jgi:predicted enzyme related to lactoylglutathione lyase
MQDKRRGRSAPRRRAGGGKAAEARRRKGRVVGLSHLFLPSSGFEDAWRFWTQAVGLSPIESWGVGAHRAGLVALGDSHMVLSGEPVGFSEEFGYESRHGLPQVFLQVKGLDALCEEMEECGATILRKPFATHWGPRAFTAQAPDGMVVGFVE